MGSPNRPRVQARGCEGDLLCVVVCHELTLITPGVQGGQGTPTEPTCPPWVFPTQGEEAVGRVMGTRQESCP